MHHQIVTMLELQDGMNSKVHADWRAQGNAWYRAIWVECAELMDHFGWKWWKQQTPDMSQVKLELVDIWHFGLSILLQRSDVVIDEIAEHVMSAFESGGVVDKNTDFLCAVEDFAQQTLVSQSFDVKKFVGLLALVNMSLADLFKQYVGKNVLNRFRQDHGYKQGTYLKIWQGKEDNVVLAALLEAHNEAVNDLPEQLYAQLKAHYPA